MDFASTPHRRKTSQEQGILLVPFTGDQPSPTPLRPPKLLRISSLAKVQQPGPLAGLACPVVRAYMGHGARYGAVHPSFFRAEPPVQRLFACTSLCKALPPSLGLPRLAGGNLWGSAASKDGRAMHRKLTAPKTNANNF